ncbi:MAG: hypothetical protein J07HQX50_00331 [Haloquadratum sp. J07HQX50]|jgi:hypothetical protein|nr:MAG: hypothetical protein J07HQX50_00331 [Haloquadratum sp. J07HQX50]
MDMLGALVADDGSLKAERNAVKNTSLVINSVKKRSTTLSGFFTECREPQSNSPTLKRGNADRVETR